MDWYPDDRDDETTTIDVYSPELLAAQKNYADSLTPAQVKRQFAFCASLYVLLVIVTITCGELYIGNNATPDTHGFIRFLYLVVSICLFFIIGIGHDIWIGEQIKKKWIEDGGEPLTPEQLAPQQIEIPIEKKKLVKDPEVEAAYDAYITSDPVPTHFMAAILIFYSLLYSILIPYQLNYGKELDHPLYAILWVFLFALVYYLYLKVQLNEVQKRRIAEGKEPFTPEQLEGTWQKAEDVPKFEDILEKDPAAEVALKKFHDSHSHPAYYLLLALLTGLATYSLANRASSLYRTVFGGTLDEPPFCFLLLCSFFVAFFAVFIVREKYGEYQLQRERVNEGKTPFTHAQLYGTRRAVKKRTD